MRGWQFEGAGAAEQKHRGEQQVAAQRVCDRGGDQHQSSRGVNSLRRAHDQPAVIAVCGMADEQRQHDGGHELDQAYQAEIESAVSNGVNLPADHYRQHLVADAGSDPRQPEQHEGALLGQPCVR
jgi:hypothetical protein